MSEAWQKYEGGPLPLPAHMLVELLHRNGDSFVCEAGDVQWRYPTKFSAEWDIVHFRPWRFDVQPPVISPRVEPVAVASQSRRGSLYEALFNVLIGFGINYVANLLIFPLFGFHISLEANVVMGLIYTVISVARTYVIRRFFNQRLQALARKLAGEPTA